MLGDFNFHADSPDCTPAVDSFDCAGLLWSHLATLIYTHTYTYGHMYTHTHAQKKPLLFLLLLMYTHKHKAWISEPDLMELI